MACTVQPFFPAGIAKGPTPAKRSPDLPPTRTAPPPCELADLAGTTSVRPPTHRSLHPWQSCPPAADARCAAASSSRPWRSRSGTGSRSRTVPANGTRRAGGWRPRRAQAACVGDPRTTSALVSGRPASTSILKNRNCVSIVSTLLITVSIPGWCFCTPARRCATRFRFRKTTVGAGHSQSGRVSIASQTGRASMGQQSQPNGPGKLGSGPASRTSSRTAPMMSL